MLEKQMIIAIEIDQAIRIIGPIFFGEKNEKLAAIVPWTPAPLN